MERDDRICGGGARGARNRKPGRRPGFLRADWSPDGKYLAGGRERADGTFSGIVVYSLASKQYRRLTDFGGDPQWLNDNRRLLFRQGFSQVFLIDSQTKEQAEVFSVDSGGLSYRLSKDNRTIFFVHWKQEADIWMLTLNE